MVNGEKKKLDSISQWYSNKNWGFYTKLVHMGYRSIEPFIKKGAILEVGPADGEMTKLIYKKNKNLTVVDGAQKYVDEIKKILPNINTHVSLVEDFSTNEKYKTIILAHVLEHVVSPLKVLVKLKKLLDKKGTIIIIVPNANSLHRMAGVKMGLLNKTTELNEADISVNHRRVYTISKLEKDIRSSELKIKKIGGIFLKPISNKQIEEQWDDELIEGFYQLGKDYPEISSELFVVCIN